MKNLKILFLIILIGFSSLAKIGCKKCKGEDPEIRVINNSPSYVDVQINTSDKKTISINNIASGTTSTYYSLSAGQIVYTVTLRYVEHIKTDHVSQCYDYDIIIDENNKITIMATDRNL